MAKKKSLEDLQKELAKKQEDIKIINRKLDNKKDTLILVLEKNS